MKQHKKCLLHIGSHKTGTSALQKALYNNQYYLRQNSWFYSLSCRHSSDYSANPIGLAIFEQKRESLDFLLRQLETEINSVPNENMILSSEILEKSVMYLPGESLFDSFIDLLQKHFNIIDIVYCIRDPFGLCNSMFKQFVSNSANPYTNSINHFINNVFRTMPTPNAVYLSWLHKVKSLHNFYVYHYSPIFQNNYNAFMKTLQFTTPSHNPGSINKSIDGIFLSLNYYFNHNLYNQTTNAVSCSNNIDTNLIQQLKQSAIRCRDTSLYYKSSIINNEYQVAIDDFTSSYYNIDNNAIILNNRFVEDKSSYRPFYQISSDEEFCDNLNTLQSKGLL